MKKHILLTMVVLIGAWGFGQTPDPQAVPAGPVEVSDGTNSAPRYEENVRPLSGVQSYDLGIRTDRLNVLTPSFTLSESYGTNPGLLFGSQSEPVWSSTTTLGGALQMARGNAKRLFSMSYLGSAQLSSYDSNLNTQIHSLEITQAIKAGRWDFLFGDTLRYQPNAYGASAPLLYAGSNVVQQSGFRPEVTPNDTVLSQQANQLTSTAVGQVSYGLSRTSVLTASASYGILRYLDGNFLDTQQFNASGGFDHRIGRNTVGVGYTYSRFMYDDLAQNFATNTVQLTFARRLLGRVTFAAGAGPTFTTTTIGSISNTNVDLSARASLQYANNRSTLDLSFSRAVTGGSGVTPGAVTNAISAGAERKLTRTISWSANGGYARNSSEASGTDFDTYYIATGVSHMVGRYMSISVGYRGQKQTSDSSFANLSTNSVVASFVWKFRPIRLQ
jgi:hypothetical protein